MPADVTANDRVVPSEVLAFCESQGLSSYLHRALNLAEEVFRPVRSVEVQIERDPETDEEAVVIDVRAPLEVDEAVARKLDYTRRWIGRHSA